MSLNLPSPAPFNRGQDLVRTVVVLLFLLLIAFGAVPHYLAGQWSGTKPPKVEGLKTLQRFVTGQLAIPGWEPVEQETVRIGELEWFQHILRPVPSETTAPGGNAASETSKIAETSEAIVLLRGQRGPRDRPQVEWTDLRGDRRWQEDQIGTLEVGSTKARWFRAWWKTESGTIHTIAVAQWYAWSTRSPSPQPWSGHWSSNVWFWQDWQNQWKGYKTPWLSVVVLIPIEPLGEISVVEPQARSLVEGIQTALGVFQ